MLNYSFVYPFPQLSNNLFVYVLLRSPNYPLVPSFMRPRIYPTIHLFTCWHLFVYWNGHLYSYSFVRAFVHPSICQFIRFCIRSTVCPSIHFFMHLSDYLSINFFVCAFVRPSIHQSIRLWTFPFPYPTVHSFVYSSTRLSMSAFVCVFASILQFIRLYIRIFARPLTHQFIRLYIRPSAHIQ